MEPGILSPKSSTKNSEEKSSSKEKMESEAENSSKISEGPDMIEPTSPSQDDFDNFLASDHISITTRHYLDKYLGLKLLKRYVNPYGDPIEVDECKMTAKDEQQLEMELSLCLEETMEHSRFSENSSDIKM